MDELIGRRVPHSPEAERAVIGSVLIDSRCVPELLSIIKPRDFYVDVNREIFETIYHMFSYSKPIDAVTLQEQMRERGTFQDGATTDYLIELMRVTPTAANALEYAAIVRDRALLRDLAEVADDITAMISEGSGSGDAMLEAAERKIYALRQGRSARGLTPISEIIPDVYSQLGRLAEMDDAMPGLATGLTDLDSKILGLGRGDFILIASRPGMGKTSIALNIAMHVGKNNKGAIAIFSLEMSSEQLVTRILAGESLIDGQKLQTGRVSANEWVRLARAAATVSATNIFIDDNPSLTVAEMNAQCRRLKNLELVVIDYLQLMQSAGGNSRSGENRQQVVSEISRMLKIMAKELNVPVVCMSQLSRANESRQNKRPLLSDLRESGAIEQDADVVIGLYREGYYDQEYAYPNEAEAIILKNRHGEVGTIDLQWIPEYTTYASAERRRDDD